jgi:anti-sigma regulatory factor (Ser/Thr protein kinase)
VESKLESLPRIGGFIEETMHRCNIESSKDIYAVQLSVDEACTNIIQHAYSNRCNGVIEISCMLKGEKFVVCIADSGEAFDPTALPKPAIDSNLDERKVGGLGIYFMSKFMTEISYTYKNCRNLLAMSRIIKKKSKVERVYGR